MNLRIRYHENEKPYIVSSGLYSKLLGIMKYPMGARVRNWDLS